MDESLEAAVLREILEGISEMYAGAAVSKALFWVIR